MKNRERRQRIEEMLRAEGLTGDRKISPQPAWNEFRKRIQHEMRREKPPRLEIERVRPARLRPWQLIPAFALLLIGVLLYFRQQTLPSRDSAQVATNNHTAKKTTRTLKKGDVFISEKRQIRFSAGSATLTQEGDVIRVAASELRADFRLRQKVDLQIEHPLLRVTVTGTEFSLDATPRGGSLNLTEGSLRIDLKSGAAGPVMLRAPIRFVFDAKTHRQQKAAAKQDRILYRYELTSGEVFFAHLVRRETDMHRVEILGGKAESIRNEDIVRFEAVDKP